LRRLEALHGRLRTQPLRPIITVSRLKASFLGSLATDFRSFPKFGSLGYDIGRLAWSPNDRYIAFVVSDTSGIKLMILDMVNKEILDVCMDAGQDLVWSPDGNQLAIFKDFPTSMQISLIDLPSLQGGILSAKVPGYLNSWILLEP
jgi:hypothetical protein